MRRVVQDKEGNRAGTIGDDAVVALAWQTVTDDHTGRGDLRLPEERNGSIVVYMSLLEARLLAGRRLAIFILEE